MREKDKAKKERERKKRKKKKREKETIKYLVALKNKNCEALKHPLFHQFSKDLYNRINVVDLQIDR